MASATVGLRTAAAPLGAALILIGVASPAARAQQWTVTSLHPAGSGAIQSFANGVFGTQQVGSATFFTADPPGHAAVWSGSAESWIDLHPPGAAWSEATATSGTQQVGWALWDAESGPQACLWSGSAASRVDLNPAGSFYSVAEACSGTQQAGWANFGQTHAGLWSGSAGSWVDLHPAGATSSLVIGASGTQQVGHATFDPADAYAHAGLWSGTADSWVDLHPAGATTSYASDTSGTQQVGSALFDPADPFLSHAGLWSGSAGSWVDLNPAGATRSNAWGTSGAQQVGAAYIDDHWHAGLWSGTAESWEDLPLVSPRYDSFARGMWSDGTTIHVVGYGVRDGPFEALLWTRPVPGPGAPGVLAITVLLGARRRRR